MVVIENALKYDEMKDSAVELSFCDILLQPKSLTVVKIGHYTHMKSLPVFILAGLLLVTCAERPDPTPSSLLPHKLVRNELTNELFYDGNNRVIKLEITAVYPGGTTTSADDFVYDADGKLTSFRTSTGWEFTYHYDQGRVVHTEEWVNGTLSQTHGFEYTAEGRLSKSITYQDIPEEGGVVPVAMDTYVYDYRGNLTRSQRYYYSTGGSQSNLLTTHDFSNYDDKINPEPAFFFSPINPTVQFFQNNPRRLEVRNGNGVLAFTDTYSYIYNTSGYATARFTRSVGSGIEDTYQTSYSYKE